MEEIIQNKDIQPTINEILNNMNESTKANYINLIQFLEDMYNGNPFIAYSSCSAMPGWNIKYKKGSKSFGTIYPDREFITMLLVVNQECIDKIFEMKDNYTNYFIQLINKSGSLNGSKWLMVCIDDEDILEDVKRTLTIKYPIKVKN